MATDGPNLRELKVWIKENMPVLNKRLQGMLSCDVLKILNEITGLKISGSDHIELSAAQYLDALRR